MPYLQVGNNSDKNNYDSDSNYLLEKKIHIIR